jgi:hypothetical protein
MRTGIVLCFAVSIATSVLTAPRSVFGDDKKAPWSDSNIHYRTVTPLLLHLADISAKTVAPATEVLGSNLKFAVGGPVYVNAGVITSNPIGAQIYYLIDVFNFTANPCPPKILGHIGCADNDNFYVMLASDFDNRLASGQIVTRQDLSREPTYRVGTTLSVPFKFRPRQDGNSRDMTLDASLGGYAGLRWRIHPTQELYINLLGTAGLSLLPITALDESAEVDAESKKTNTVPGFTWSAGVVLELDSFQLGFLLGRDYATGDAGDAWLYDTKTWYALSVGFTFLGTGTDSSKPSKDQDP